MTRLGLTLLLNKLYLLTYTLLYSSPLVALSDRYQQRVTYACATGDHVYSNSLKQYTLLWKLYCSLLTLSGRTLTDGHGKEG